MVSDRNRIKKSFLLVIALVLACTATYATKAQAPADVPILRMNTRATPPIAAVGQQITFQADVFSTSDITETMTITATVEPWQKLAAAGYYYDTTIGPADCDPTLFHLVCRIPIKRWYPVTIFAVIDAPLLADCKQQVALHVIATLPNRISDELIPVPITGGTRCYFIPAVHNGR